MIEFELIKKSIFKTILFGLIILMPFLPAYTHDKFSNLTDTNFWGIWSIVFFVIIVLYKWLVKRYTIIGLIEITTEKISISKGSVVNKVFLPSEKLNITLDYKGAKGEKERYSIIQLPIFRREGVGTLYIENKTEKYKYDFVALKCYSKGIFAFARYYEKEGNRVIINRT